MRESILNGKNKNPMKVIKIKAVLRLMWSDDSVSLEVYPRDWNSGIWISRFYLANEIEKNHVAGFGPCWPGHEGDRPLENMGFTCLPFRKPKKVKALKELRDRKVPAEPKRKAQVEDSQP